jgi:hypothetical protein
MHTKTSCLSPFTLLVFALFLGDITAVASGASRSAPHSGNGMNSDSHGTVPKRPCFQSRLACGRQGFRVKNGRICLETRAPDPTSHRIASA